MWCEGIDWIQLTLDRVQWRADVNTAVKIQAVEAHRVVRRRDSHI
jgi:hypothetical protein